VTTSVDTQKVKEDAETYFRQGNSYCSEAIVASIRDNVVPQLRRAHVSRREARCGSSRGWSLSHTGSAANGS
jgi:hypothetical protein